MSERVTLWMVVGRYVSMMWVRESYIADGIGRVGVNVLSNRELHCGW